MMKAARSAFFYLCLWIFATVSGQVEGDQSNEGFSIDRFAPWMSEELFMPPAEPGESVLVMVDFYLVAVTDIDLTSQRFTVITSRVIQWNDQRLAFDPEKVGRGSVEFTNQAALEVLRAMWNPTVSIANRYYDNSPLFADILLTIYHSGLVTYEIEDSVSASYTADLHHFPFDSQTLTLTLSTFGRLQESIDLELLSAIPASDTNKIVPSNYMFTGMTSDKLSRTLMLGSPDYININIKVDRRGRYYVWRHMLPLIVLAMISSTVFWMTGTALHDRLKITAISMLTIVTFMLFLNRELPRVPYLTVMGCFYVSIFLLPLCAAIQSMVVDSALKKGNRERAEMVDRIARIAFAPMLVLFFITIFYLRTFSR